MSLINQMLQELEQRRTDGGPTAAQVRAVSKQGRPKPAPWVMGLLALAVLAAGLGYWIVSPPGVKAVALPLTPVVAPLLSAQPATHFDAVAMPQVLQLDSELGASPAPAENSLDPIAPKPTPVAPDAKAAQLQEEPQHKPSVATAPPHPVGINKEIKQLSPQQGAENAFRQAYSSLQLGRMGEAEESLRQALQLDPRHAASRQALAALLVETKHLDRAEQVLQQGLELQSGHTGYAMTLARLQVERGDVAAGLATLQRNPPAGENPEYHGFLAALLQRMERHKEAIEHYQAALRVSPTSGPWLLGLGISLQADSQAARAAELFRRARQSNSLSPELQAFADQRLKQLQ